MIVSSLQGGLGNMMFQIAAGLHLSSQLNTEFYYTYDWWQCCTSYSIDHYPNTIFKNLNPISREGIQNNPTTLQYYSQNSMQYEPIPVKNNLIIRGLFQTEKYFLESFDLIKSMFFVPKIDKYMNYTFIHIRRGDYLKFQHIHPVLSEDYYREALDLINATKVVVLTDDKQWVRSSELFGQFEVPDTENDLEDLSIMRSCQNAIIANSTFSWWGAWLSDAQKVITPAKWLNTDYNIDIIPSRWIKI